jgi:intracellular septation protein
MNQFTKLLTEITPIIIFFWLFKTKGMSHATIGLIITTVLSLIINYIFEKKISYVMLFSCLIIIICGGITLYTGDSKFIKLKPTIINLSFAVILLIGVALKKGLIKHICGNMLEMSEPAWIQLSIRWALFFIFLAVLNEYIWRNFDDKIWINFKVFGILPLTIIFTLTQLPFLNKNKIES